MNYFAGAIAFYHLLFISGILIRLGIYIDPYNHVSISLGLLLFLTFLKYPSKKGQVREYIPWYDILFSICALMTCGYRVFFQDFAVQHFVMGTPSLIEDILFFMLIIVTFEAVRRAIGLIVVVVAAIFFIYSFTSNYLPGMLHARSLTVPEATAGYFLSDSAGIFGMPIFVSAYIIFPFIIFGSFLVISGSGKFFIQLSMSLAGKFRGGPAKTAVIASALFGTMSGSPPANVAATGSITIPLMKQCGYDAKFAAAVEAVASTGGIIMPPVMGVVAFLIAESIGSSYIDVCLAGLIPASIYFVTLLVGVHLQAVKDDLRGLPVEQIPPFLNILKEGWYHLIPILALILFLVVLRFTPEQSAVYATLVIAPIALFAPERRFQPKNFVTALAMGSILMLLIGPVVGLAGVILGSINVTGIGVVITGNLLSISGGNLFLTLLLSCILAYIMGMSMGVVVIYIVLSALVAPSLTKLGVSPIAAHLFIFYWGATSFITPPLAIASFVAAGIAKADPIKTGWISCRLGLILLVIPFMFVYEDALLFDGTAFEITSAFITGIIGATFLSASIVGYFTKPLNYLQRLLVLICGLLVIYPGLLSDLIGIGLFLFTILTQYKGKRKFIYECFK